MTQNRDSITAGQKYITISAGAEYKTSPFHQWLWGKNWRQVWATPVTFPVAYLDTMKGGLKPEKAGGGNQTKSLHMESTSGRNYTFRSVNKTLGKVLPEDLLNTFAEDLVNDKVSMGFPYGAVVVPHLASKIGVYHTTPAYYYLPKQPALDSFNKKYGNDLYLFEQRLAGSWKGAAHLGNFDDFNSTDKMVEDRLENHNNVVDQRQYIKSRLFDMLLNDWDRHEDQWEWGAKDSAGIKIYQPVPKDRDQSFFTYNGVLLKFLIGAAGLDYFQPFKERIKDVNAFNFEQRNSDRFFANEMTMADWQQAARFIQQSLTDVVIDEAVKKLPPEVYGIAAPTIASTLKARRDRLHEDAKTYYLFIAEEVDIPGSDESELFEINQLNDLQTMVNIYRIDNNGIRQSRPYYSRTFDLNETKEIRLYGIGKSNKFIVKGVTDNDITIRIIGGEDKDSIVLQNEKKRVHVYDDADNVTIAGRNVRRHFSNDSAIHEFKYKSYTYDKSGISPTIFYTNEDRLFVGLGYKRLIHKWRKEPFASRQSLQLNYSISQRAPSVWYEGLFPKTVGKWDLVLAAHYDAVNWINFFGLGNETKFIEPDIDFYRARTSEWMGNLGVMRRFGNHLFNINSFYHRVRLIHDEERFTGKALIPANPHLLKPRHFVGGEIQYNLQDVNDIIVPTKGLILFGNAAYTQNIVEKSRTVTRLGADAHIYLPLFHSFSLALRAGSSTVFGDPEFYQYANIGGSQTVRAFRRQRFWGKSAVYNSNEIRFIRNVKSYIYNGKIGFVAFYDNGRVWMPNETSNVWHHGYGGGILLAPFNKISAEVTYGISKDEKLFQLRITRLLKY